MAFSNHIITRHTIQQAVVVLAITFGCYARFSGIAHGVSDFVPEQQRGSATSAFYSFHPDEETLIRASLELDSPLAPPLTAYGMLPLYLLKGALAASATLFGFELTLAADEERRAVFLTARVLSAALSTLSLLVLWRLARRLDGAATAAVSVWCLAAAPAAIQQAHFYTVDGLFTLMSLLVFHALWKSLESGTRPWYAATGLLLGALGAVRFIGLLMALVLVAGRLLQKPHAGAARMRRLLEPELLLAGGAAALSLLALQPYLIANPAAVLAAGSTDDVGFSMAIASGELLRIWSLVDVHSVPYLHYWTDLMPQAVGWPLALTFAVALAATVAALRLSGLVPLPAHGLVLLWTALFFAVVGGLHTKHVRYLLPLLPFFAMMAGGMISRWVSGGSAAQRRLAAVAAALVIGYTTAYALAFTRLYHREDSRIAAARWLAQQAPAGSRIGIESGGFSLAGLIDERRYAIKQLTMPVLFESRGYLTCGAALSYLHERVRPLDYLAFTDVNRQRPFAAVPEMLPAAAGFYQRLARGELGFSTAARFANKPQLAVMRFEPKEPEPSFVAFDHPTTLVFQSAGTEAVDAAFQQWRQNLRRGDNACGDHLLLRAVQAAQNGQPDEAIRLFSAAESSAQGELSRMLRHSVRPQGIELTGETAMSSALGERRQQHMIPWAVAMSTIDLGIPAASLQVLADGARRSAAAPTWGATRDDQGVRSHRRGAQ